MNDFLKSWREITGRKPRVLILADVPNWAYDINSQGLRKVLSDEFDIDIAYLHYGPFPNLYPDYYDLYHVCCWIDLVGHYGIEKERFVKEVSSHRWEEPRYGSLNPRQFCQKYLADSATITATSRRLQALIQPIRPCLLVPNGIGDIFRPAPAPNEGPLVFGWAGNANDSCKGLKDVLLPASFHLVNIEMAPGNVNHAQMADFYRQLDVLCVASDREGEPLTLIEGMACGCFPVCTDVGVVPELIKNGENGLIVGRAPEDFRRAFIWCNEHPEKVREEGKKNSELIKRTRGWDKVKGAWRRAWIQALSLRDPQIAAKRREKKENLTLPGQCARAIEWLQANRIGETGITATSKNRRPYPEVTGYLIPTLLAWGERDLAISFGQWLLSVQAENGAFRGPDDEAFYVFDTGQVIRGFIALLEHGVLDCREAMQKACEWICGQIHADGSQDFPDILQWRKGSTPEGVILYALEPARRAAAMLGKPDLVQKIDACVSQFIKNPALTDFTCLSHFHAYICEALFDLGFRDLAAQGMAKAWARRLKDGGLPGYANVPWTCSTGMFQYAGILHKLGDTARAEETFDYMGALQNPSGGWYGSYGPEKKYFPDAEIAWAIKYFLDSLRLRQISSFESLADRFLPFVSGDDGRWLLLKSEVEKYLARTSGKIKLLDVGCGKGRYLHRLAESPFADRLELYGCDISPRVLSHVKKGISIKVGGVLDLPYGDGGFDFVFSSEVLEHSIRPQSGLAEMLRVLKAGGELLVIDKNIERLGRLKLHETEQWFTTSDILETLRSLGADVRAIEGVPYENGCDNLFTAWIALKNTKNNLAANLSADGWHEAIVAYQDLEALARKALSGHSPKWLGQILEATNPGETCLELGSGTGALSAALALQGRKVILLDFSQESLDFSKKLFARLDLDGEFVQADILGQFPFANDYCDCVWSSGVLEHFSATELAHIMGESARVSRKTVISLVPNAASLPYRLGKWLQERQGIWKYGYEDPKFSLGKVFVEAGLREIAEYSIEPFHALEFMKALPGLAHVARDISDFYSSLDAEGLNRMNQGYLLVTKGRKGIEG